jgi:hypothetical protein
MSISKWVKKWNIEGSNGNIWTVAIDNDGNYGCSCPVWKFKRIECHHIEQVRTAGEKELISKAAMPGNVGEVMIKRDVVLYPLVPMPPPVDLVATIIYDMQRAGVKPDKIKDYKNKMFRGSVSLRSIREHVERHGWLIFTKFQKGYGWIEPTHVSYDTPIKTLKE